MFEDLAFKVFANPVQDSTRQSSYFSFHLCFVWLLKELVFSDLLPKKFAWIYVTLNWIMICLVQLVLHYFFPSAG